MGTPGDSTLYRRPGAGSPARAALMSITYAVLQNKCNHTYTYDLLMVGGIKLFL